MNVVSKIKQVGYEIVLDGAKTIGYQHSCNLYVQLTMDPSSSSPFKDCVITAACSRWDSEMPDICPIEEIDNKKYILLAVFSWSLVCCIKSFKVFVLAVK